MASVGRVLLMIGLGLSLLGLLLIVRGAGWVGRLPGDLVFKRQGLQVHIPLVSSIVVSVILTVLLKLFLRRK